MKQSLAIVIGLTLLAPALTGCLGIGGDEGGSGGLEGTESKAKVSSSTGGIEGVVTDSAVQAVEDVEVTIEELDESTTTATDGSFAFSEITPGAYTLRFQKDGFITTEKSVDVVANDVATVELVIAHEPSIEPFMQQFKFEGFLECSGGFSSPVPVPATPVLPSFSGLSAAACSIPNSYVEGNATNDRFIFYHPIEPNPWQVVGELQWEPNNEFSSRLSLTVEPGGLPNDPQTEYGDQEGGPPVIVRADRGRIAEIVANTTAVCDGTKDPGGGTLSAPADAYCNRNPIESGGQVQLRVFVQPYEPAGNNAGAAAAVQQSFTVFNTIFYNAPACEEYSITQETLCPQQESPPEVDPYDGSAGDTSNGSTGNTSG